MRKTTKNYTPKNMLEFLREAHRMCDSTDGKFNMTELMEMYNIPNTSSVVLQKSGILQMNRSFGKKGKGGSQAQWFWSCTIIPNLEMARVTIEKIKAHTKQSNKKYSKNKETKQSTNETKIELGDGPNAIESVKKFIQKNPNSSLALFFDNEENSKTDYALAERFFKSIMSMKGHVINETSIKLIFKDALGEAGVEGYRKYLLQNQIN